MKSYCLYFVLLVFCSSNCCGWDYQGDDYISTGKEVIYLLEGINGNPIILHNEVYDQINTCEEVKTVATPTFLNIYSFEDSTNRTAISEINLLLYNQDETKLLDDISIDRRTPYYLNQEEIYVNASYNGIWQTMTYKKFEEENRFILKISGVDYKNNIAFITGTYNLSSLNKMQIEKSYDLSGVYLNRARIDILEIQNGSLKAIRIKDLTEFGDYRSLGASMSLYKNVGDSSLFIANSSVLGSQTSVFLTIPDYTDSFEGYIDIVKPYKDLDSVIMTIQINF